VEQYTVLDTSSETRPVLLIKVRRSLKNSKKATFACVRAVSLNYCDCFGDRVGKISKAA
jgi:hypothetical protein